MSKYRLNLESVARVGFFLLSFGALFTLSFVYPPREATPPWWVLTPLMISMLASVLYLSAGNAGTAWMLGRLKRFFLIEKE